MWGLWLLAVCVAHFKHNYLGQSLPADKSTLCQLWKLCSALFSACVVHHTLITAAFWILLYDGNEQPTDQQKWTGDETNHLEDFEADLTT